ncbi:assembly of actin patch protein [Malassezia japonica]|uniref:Assembly of actin patch protein n=1 Tax=Malassezia japonica TaxID=223818 RepID=A0AAF0JF98_9BASI|nr:assembly of actin patch protein [Malassezia japonica]WFD38746.1 assembly of actin patch protein [Malassezia japonica]
MSFPAYVQSIVKYKSPHPQDLSFVKGATIRVLGLAERPTDDDDDDDEEDRWYIGELIDRSRKGQFPASLVTPVDAPREEQEDAAAVKTAAPPNLDSTAAPAPVAVPLSTLPTSAIAPETSGADDVAPSVPKEQDTVPGLEHAMQHASLSDTAAPSGAHVPVPEAPTAGERAPQVAPGLESVPASEPSDVPAVAAPAPSVPESATSPTTAPEVAPAAPATQTEPEPKAALAEEPKASEAAAPAAPKEPASEAPPQAARVPDADAPDPSRMSLRDRIAAFNKSAEKAPPPIPKGKPGGWKRPPPPENGQKPPMPATAEAAIPAAAPPPHATADPTEVDAVRNDTSGSFSASDAKSSIKMSLKERMAALQRTDAEAKAAAPPPPRKLSRDVPVEEAGAEAEEPSEDEAARRAALAQRMARMGGQRMGPFGGAAPPKEAPKDDEALREPEAPADAQDEPVAEREEAPEATSPETLVVPRRTAAPRTRRAKAEPQAAAAQVPVPTYEAADAGSDQAANVGAAETSAPAVPGAMPGAEPAAEDAQAESVTKTTQQPTAEAAATGAVLSQTVPTEATSTEAVPTDPSTKALKDESAAEPFAPDISEPLQTSSAREPEAAVTAVTQAPTEAPFARAAPHPTETVQESQPPSDLSPYATEATATEPTSAPAPTPSDTLASVLDEPQQDYNVLHGSNAAPFPSTQDAPVIPAEVLHGPTPGIEDARAAEVHRAPSTLPPKVPPMYPTNDAILPTSVPNTSNHLPPSEPLARYAPPAPTTAPLVPPTEPLGSTDIAPSIGAPVVGPTPGMAHIPQMETPPIVTPDVVPQARAVPPPRSVPPPSLRRQSGPEPISAHVTPLDLKTDDEADDFSSQRAQLEQLLGESGGSALPYVSQNAPHAEQEPAATEAPSFSRVTRIDPSKEGAQEQPPAQTSRTLDAPSQGASLLRANSNRSTHAAPMFVPSPSDLSFPSTSPTFPSPLLIPSEIPEAPKEEAAPQEAPLSEAEQESERRAAIAQRLARMGGQRIAGLPGMPPPPQRQSVPETEAIPPPATPSSPPEAPVVPQEPVMPEVPAAATPDTSSTHPRRPVRRAPTLPPNHQAADEAVSPATAVGTDVLGESTAPPARAPPSRPPPTRAPPPPAASGPSPYAEDA